MLYQPSISPTKVKEILQRPLPRLAFHSERASFYHTPNGNPSRGVLWSTHRETPCWLVLVIYGMWPQSGEEEHNSRASKFH